MSKEAEKQIHAEIGKIIDEHKTQITSLNSRIKELEDGLKLAQTMILAERDKHLEEKGHSSFSTYNLIIIDHLLTIKRLSSPSQ